MNTLFLSPNFPLVTTMELSQPMKMSEYLLRDELQRLIQEEKEQVAIQQAMDLLVMPEQPVNRRDLLELLMETDEIQILLREVRGSMMEEADQEMIDEHNEKTLLSFLIEVTNWLETR